jgi:AcrR family transcriptional regulator
MPGTRTLKSIKPSASLRSGTHPTHDKLLQTTVELMEEHLPQAITSDMVLQKSGVSRGSLYHHFGDFSALLELAMVNAFSKEVDRSIASFTKLLGTAKSKEEMLAGVFAATTRTQSRALKQLRFQRARVIICTEDNPRLAAILAFEQQRLTDALAGLMHQAQENGWMNKTFNPCAGAVLIQAYTLGKIVDDVVENKMSEQVWDDLINQVISKVFAA